MTDASKILAPNSMGQFSLTLPARPPRYDREHFVLSTANDAAWRAGKAWSASGEPAMTICGPEGAGKTHLLHVLLAELGGVYVMDQKNLDPKISNDLIGLDGASEISDPAEFLAKIEDILGGDKRLILVGRGQPSDWAGGLKDLRTRLEAMPRAQLSEPDEAMVRAVMAKGFKDRQVTVGKAVIEYAAVRLPRTFLAAHRFVEAADQAALNEKKKVSVQLAQKVLEAHF